jgi:hypothetical protein
VTTIEINAARFCISESEANRKFGRGIVRLVLPQVVVAGIKYYSAAQLRRKQVERPVSYQRAEPTHGERMAARS